MSRIRPRAGFVGRLDALAALDEMYSSACAGQAGVVLIGGEAGIGKSRLVSEFIGRASEAWVLTGGCLALGVDGPSYAPFTAALRALVREIGTVGITDLLAEDWMVRDLARLLPAFGDPPNELGETRGRLFETVLELLTKLASIRPLVLVLEDVHWADHASRDLLLFLTHNLGDMRALIIVTYRDDDGPGLTRAVLADLTRSKRIVRLDLPRLTRDEVASLATGVLGRPAQPRVVDVVYARSDGNPFLVEMLLASADLADVTDAVPGPLRDLLVSAVLRLPEPSQRIVRAAAVGGVEVSHELLSASAGLTGAPLEDALRPAVRGQVLIAVEDGYAFRHALIRDAVYEGLVLPGERVRLHRRYAEAIDASPTLVLPGRAAAALAHHWYSTGSARAFVAAWRAAEQAKIMLARAERLNMLERVLTLWSRVPDPAGELGTDRVDVLRQAVEAADQCGEYQRGLTMVGQVLGAVDDEGDLLRAGWAYFWRARLQSKLSAVDARDDLTTAIRLVQTGPATVERARLLGQLAHWACVLGMPERGRTLAASAQARGVEVGDRYAEAQAITTLASLWADDGDMRKARDAFARARTIAATIGAPILAAHADIEESHALEGAGQHARAMRAARTGLTRARETGLLRTLGAILAENLTESLISLGRWSAALEVIRRAVDLAPPQPYLVNLYCLRGRLQLARGELAAATESLTAIGEAPGGRDDVAMYRFARARFEADMRLALDRPEEAWSVIARAFHAFPPAREPRYAWPLIVAGARAQAGAAARGQQVDDGLSLSPLARFIPCRTPVEQAHRETYLAITAAPAERRVAVVAALNAWEQTRQPWPRARLLLDCADLDVADGDRVTAEARLRRCVALAEPLGAIPLLDRAHALARRARITVRDTEPPASRRVPNVPSGLTARELDVLRLLATGQSNRQIAERLFVSPKTVSVHVSHILGKMGVANRGEAAAVSHRLSLFGDDPLEA